MTSPRQVPGAGVVLAGGRSRRMGTTKALLEWHGTTLLQRTVEVLGRSAGGPVVVVRAPGQALPELPPGVVVREDPEEGLGPLQGLAVGLSAAAERGAARAFVCATDLPFLHPAYVRRVLALLDEDADVVLPVVGGFRQPLAAAYRSSLAGACARLVAQRRLRPAFLFDEVRTVAVDEELLLRERTLREGDPGLASVAGVNAPQDYRDARARPAPQVTVVDAHGSRTLRAGSLDAVGGAGPGTSVDGRPAQRHQPLLEGDVVELRTGQTPS